MLMCLRNLFIFLTTIICFYGDDYLENSFFFFRFLSIRLRITLEDLENMDDGALMEVS